MGCYSIQCAVSGIPIYAEDCVMITVEKSRYSASGRSSYVPTNLPVFGKADSYGRLEGHYIKEDYVMIKREIWDAADLFKSPENTYHPNGIFIKIDEIKKEVAQQKEWFPNRKFTDNDLISKILLSSFSYEDGCDNHILNELFFNGEQLNLCGDPDSEYNCVFNRSRLKDLIVNKIANDALTQEDLDSLTKICRLWNGVPFLLGKELIPVAKGFFCEQHTDKKYLKTRTDIFKHFNKVMKEMKV